jgi:hypothetical protein
MIQEDALGPSRGRGSWAGLEARQVCLTRPGQVSRPT